MMLKQIMDSINNHFIFSRETLKINIQPPNVLTGSFRQIYLPGQYIYLQGTIINDDVYQITSFLEPSMLLQTDALKAETTDLQYTIYGLRVPQAFLDLAAEIKAYNAGHSDGVSSERIDDYAVTYADEGGWKSVFAKRLSVYRRMFTDLR